MKKIKRGNFVLLIDNEDAVKQYNEWALIHHGEFSRLNVLI